MREDETSRFYPRRWLNPCETPGCSGNCAYAWSCHNARVLGRGGYFWPGIMLALALIGMVFVR